MRHSWTIAVLDRDTPGAQIIFVRAKAHGPVHRRFSGVIDQRAFPTGR